MLTGAHVILYSRNADADRDFVRDVLGFPHVDVGHGWLIFALPPAEVALHPTEGSGSHELYLMCDDVGSFVASMQAKGVACAPVHEERWGSLTQITLPGGGSLGVYQPRHASPVWGAARTAKKIAKPAPKKNRSKPALKKKRPKPAPKKERAKKAASPTRRRR
jgi:catechol 2,3-dioxygenase-like lactoylglutathione lyase family enzyme